MIGGHGQVAHPWIHTAQFIDQAVTLQCQAAICQALPHISSLDRLANRLTGLYIFINAAQSKSVPAPLARPLVQIDHKRPGTGFRRCHVPWRRRQTSSQCVADPPRGSRRRHCLQPIEFGPQYCVEWLTLRFLSIC